MYIKLFSHHVIIFYSSFNTEIQTIDILLKFLTGNLKNSLANSIQGISAVFYMQLSAFVLGMGSLLFAFYYTSRRYLVEKRNALIDPLTGIYNRKAVFFALKQELRKTERKEKHPTTVAMMDLDYFKCVFSFFNHKFN